MSLARIAHTQKKSLHTFHEHPFLINCKNLCRFWHGHSISVIEAVAGKASHKMTTRHINYDCM